MKHVEHYMSLPYTVEIRNIPENEGGGVTASIPQLGKYAFCADGESVEEALDRLEELKRELFSEYLEKGVTIPEPEPEDGAFSGKFLVRMPKYLHRELFFRAKREGVSLNQLVCSLLAVAVFVTDMADEVNKVGKRINRLSSRLNKLWNEFSSIDKAGRARYRTHRSSKDNILMGREPGKAA